MSDTSKVCLSLDSPWPGLRAFTETEHEFFFGRDAETEELAHLVERSSVVVLYGQSGLGKTSLLQAGLLRQLKPLDFVPVLVRLDYDENALPLHVQIQQRLAAELQRASIEAQPAGDETLWEYFHRRDLDFWGPRNRLFTPLLILDQFEEIFTLGQRNAVVASRVEQFIGELEALIEHRPTDAIRERLEAEPEYASQFSLQKEAVKFVFSLREDFLPHIDTLRTRMPSVVAHRLRLEQMTRQQAFTVIRKSGRDLVDDDVAWEIVGFLSSSRRLRTASETEHVEPALLSLVCDELNRRRIERGLDRITAQLIAGEREEIINDFYERAFEGLAPEIREWVEDELLTASGYRDRSAVEDALRAGVPESAIAQLVDRRLLHREERGNVMWLELTHDLLTDPAMSSRAARLQRHEIESARQRETAVKRELHRTRRTVAAMGALLVLAIVFLAFALVATNNARRQQKIAEAARESATEMFNTAFTLAEKYGIDLSGDLWMPTAAVNAKIGMVETTYRALSKEKGGFLIERRSHFLAQSALAMLQSGQVAAAVETARAAVAKISGMDSNDVPRDRVRLTQAEALRAYGDALTAAGQYKEADRHFEQAASLAAGVIKHSALRLEAAQTHVRAKLGRARIADMRYADDTATAHTQDALRFLDQHTFDEDERRKLRTSALLQASMTGSTNEISAAHLVEAHRIATDLVRRHPKNFILQRVLAEVEHQRGFVSMASGDYVAAGQHFDAASQTFKTLTERDPDNLEWRLGLASSVRGKALVAEQLAPSRAQTSYDEASELVAPVLRQQPQWTRPRTLAGALKLNLADLVRARSDGPLKKGETERDREADRAVAAQLLTDARTIYVEGTRFAPEYIRYHQGIARVMDRQAQMAFGNKQFEHTLGMYVDAFKQLEHLPAHADVLSDRAHCESWRGYTYYSLKKYGESSAAYRRAIDALVARHNPSAEIEYEKSKIHRLLAQTLLEAKERRAALKELQRSSDAIDRAMRMRITPRQQANLLLMRSTVANQRAELFLQDRQLARAAGEAERATHAAWAALQIDYGRNDLLTALKTARTSVATVAGTIQKQDADRGIKAEDDPVWSRLAVVWERTDPLSLMPDPIEWRFKPFTGGNWQVVPDKELRRMLGRLKLKNEFTAANKIVARKLILNFYRNGVLYDAQATLDSGETASIVWIVRDDETILLDGQASVIYAMNRRSAPMLDTIEQAVSYLRFFLACIGNDSEGRFLVVDSEDDLPLHGSLKPNQRREIAAAIRPLNLQESPRGFWQGTGTIVYNTALGYAIFQVNRDGSIGIEVLKEIPASSYLLVDQLFSNSIRKHAAADHEINRLRAKLIVDPKDANALRQLPDAYDRAKRWKEAVEAQQKWIETLTRTPKTDEEKSELAGAYLSLSWYQLFAQDFAGALASTETGKQFDATYLPLDTNRAHALFFLGRKEEAEKVYVGNIGQKIGDREWQEVILEDLEYLQREGLFADPALNHLRSALRTATSTEPPATTSSSTKGQR